MTFHLEDESTRNCPFHSPCRTVDEATTFLPFYFYAFLLPVSHALPTYETCTMYLEGKPRRLKGRGIRGLITSLPSPPTP